MNVRLLLIPIISLSLLSGCASFSLFDKVEPVKVQTKAVEKTPLNLPNPSPLSTQIIKWVVVTPDNIEEVWAKLKEDKQDLVLFALTADGYERLSINTIETRNFILSQKNIIIQYKKYYE